MVMPREGHGSRNGKELSTLQNVILSCPARGMGVEIRRFESVFRSRCVMPREGHGSRN